MTNIVERLRVWPAAYGEDAMSSTYVGQMAKNAADEIERLRSALSKIEKDEKNCADHCRRQAGRALAISPKIRGGA